jgi:hypothetical protein
VADDVASPLVGNDPFRAVSSFFVGVSSPPYPSVLAHAVVTTAKAKTSNIFFMMAVSLFGWAATVMPIDPF